MNRTTLSLLAIVLACTLSPTPQARAGTLTPRVYLPIIAASTAITELPLSMDLYIENNTCGRLCYQILDVGPVECMRRQGKAFYKAIPHGEYKFWAQGCIDESYVLGRAPFTYRSATLYFSCGFFEGPIWAKMYEMR